MSQKPNPLDIKALDQLFQLADNLGKKRYHRLTPEDFQRYLEYDRWRYINGDYECGTTQESQQWVNENSDQHCPICEQRFSFKNGRTIDHKLPRSQYPWLSMDFDNLWVICRSCNQEKAEMHWYEYERYILKRYPDRYGNVRFYRPMQLLKTLLS